MATMTPDECRAFMMAGTRTLKVATVRKDGRAHVAPVWFVQDGDTLVFATGLETVKGRNLRRDPRVSLLVEDETPPYAFVAMEGTATLWTDLDELRHWNRQIAARYMPPEKVAVTTERNTVVGEALVRVTLTRMRGERGVAD